MISLLSTILFSTLLNVVFRITKDKNVNLIYLISINYWTCTVIALFAADFPSIRTIPPAIISHGCVMGGLFVLGFYVLSLTIKHFGISLATVIQKVSLIIPVSLAFLVYGHIFTINKLVGILLAFIAIFTMQKEITFRSRPHLSSRKILLPAACFAVSGIVDSGFMVIAENQITNGNEETILLTGAIFVTAAVTGTFISIMYMLNKKYLVSRNDLIYGICLGIPNFFSVKFLYEAVESLSGAVVFPIFNAGVIILASLTGYILFREKLKPVTIAGIIIACLSIVILSREV